MAKRILLFQAAYKVKENEIGMPGIACQVLPGRAIEEHWEKNNRKDARTPEGWPDNRLFFPCFERRYIDQEDFNECS